MNPIHKYEILIRESHLDTFGHVNNATYLALFEEARWDLITSRGYGLAEIHKVGKGPIILEIKLQFKKELRLRQKITIQSQMLSYKGKVGTIKQWMTNQPGDLCCEMEMVFGLFDLKTRKLVEPTPEWSKALGL